MKDTYEKASYVLVLDSQLQETCLGASQSASDIAWTRETAVRIVNSGWMRRLWTFQEGRLAKRLSFQFADQVVQHRELMHSLVTCVENGFSPITADMFRAMVPIARDLRYDDGVGRSAFITSQAVFNAIAWRSTSNAQDEAVCIASIFGLDSGQFVDIPLEQHVPRLLLQVRKIPISVLFADGTRHQSPGFTWCSRSFLNFQREHWVSTPPIYAECTESGLRVSLPGWIIPPSTL